MKIYLNATIENVRSELTSDLRVDDKLVADILKGVHFQYSGSLVFSESIQESQHVFVEIDAITDMNVLACLQESFGVLKIVT